MPIPASPAWGRAHQLAERLPFLFTRRAKHQTVSELLAVLKQALEARRR